MQIVEIKKLKAHERTEGTRLGSLAAKIRRDGILKMPILVDSESMTILDGHHRVESLKRLKIRKVPAILIDYRSKAVKVVSRRKNKKITKGEIVSSALAETPFPPRTSRHIYAKPASANTPLELLR